MRKLENYLIFLLSFFSVQFAFMTKPALSGGAFGAEIFCSMREGGNDHESSWEASYEYIKRQKGGLFKISPKQAAGQIVETVVREKDKFEYCVPYLSELYPEKKVKLKNKKSKNNDIGESNESTNEFDRYSY